MRSKLYVLGLALTGCMVAISGYVLRQHARRQTVRLDAADMVTWEGEGGQPAPATLTAIHTD
jgi:hypothetical protein